MQERWFPLNALQTHAAAERRGGKRGEEQTREERGDRKGKKEGKNSVFSHLGFLDERRVYVFGCLSFGFSQIVSVCVCVCVSGGLWTIHRES